MRKSIFILTAGSVISLFVTVSLADETSNQGITPPGISSAYEEIVHSSIDRLNKLEPSAPAHMESISEIRQLSEEVDRLGADIAFSNGIYTVASMDRANLLERLMDLQGGCGPRIENTVNPNPEQKQAINTIRATRRLLAEAGAIPVWDGKKWIDGRHMAFNGAVLSSSSRDTLIELNYWEQNYGTLSIPEELHDIMTVSGEASAAISSLKKQLEQEGLFVELDKLFGIWKIRGDKEN